jgi:hypothetical protein
MKVLVNQDSKVLIPNSEHKNFTETNEVIGKENVLSGEIKNVEGLRKGKPFTYRLFITNNNKIIYLKNITPMQTTEVTLGADSQRTDTIVNLVPAETFNKVKTMGLVLGALAGFGYCKYKKCDSKTTVMYIFGGALVGYASAYLVDRNRKGTVIASK